MPPSILDVNQDKYLVFDLGLNHAEDSVGAKKERRGRR
jgi:hypothetical protein